jgi:peptidoglycan hydrolase-like protein with peptidoglycan-binding domain
LGAALEKYGGHGINSRHRIPNLKGCLIMAAATSASSIGPGSQPDMIRAVQHALIANGYSVGTTGADGVFGSHTTAALEAFQGDAALSVAPVCDAATWAALGPKNGQV